MYRAKDTRLPRDAAIKVSAEKFNERFAGEAHAIASLNHPNITTLYDVGSDYLVMELVEGPTLASVSGRAPCHSIKRSALPGRSPMHAITPKNAAFLQRDLKPGNAKIRPDDVVKVLDFALEKVGVGQEASRSLRIPMTAPRTQAGTSVDTITYKKTEHLKDRRWTSAPISGRLVVLFTRC